MIPAIAHQGTLLDIGSIGSLAPWRLDLASSKLVF
jgi:hypothetical protein